MKISRVYCVDSTSLRLSRRLNHIILTIRHFFTSVDRLTWVNVGGGCYRVVSGHGSPFRLDGENITIMHACFLYMFLLSIHGDGHCCS